MPSLKSAPAIKSARKPSPKIEWDGKTYAPRTYYRLKDGSVIQTTAMRMFPGTDTVNYFTGPREEPRGIVNFLFGPVKSGSKRRHFQTSLRWFLANVDCQIKKP